MDSAKIDESSLRQTVDAFYARVRQDEQLGPVFNDAIGDWPAHLGRLGDFWSSVMLGSGRYKGQPVPAHLKHRDRISPALFERWLALWAETTEATMPPAAASALQEKAGRIAESLQLALFFRLGADAPPKARQAKPKTPQAAKIDQNQEGKNNEPNPQ